MKGGVGREGDVGGEREGGAWEGKEGGLILCLAILRRRRMACSWMPAWPPCLPMTATTAATTPARTAVKCVSAGR
jgi:hypothetical protein